MNKAYPLQGVGSEKPSRTKITMIAALRTNWFILRTGVEERLVYRGDFAFATLVRFLPIVTQVFLWGAIFASTPKTSINGYSYSEMVSYYLLAMVARAFSSMPGLAGGIARDVRDGTIKKFLTQPVDLLGFLFWHRIAHKLVYYAVAIGPFALVFWLCRAYLPALPDAATLFGFAVSLLFGFLIGFLIESLIGLISFWFLEVSSLLFIYMMLNFFLSGHMIPLDFFGEPWAGYMKALPFEYLAYFPAAVMLGKFTHAELFRALAVELAWIVALLVANRITFARGVRRYGAFGG